MFTATVPVEVPPHQEVCSVMYKGSLSLEEVLARAVQLGWLQSGIVLSCPSCSYSQSGYHSSYHGSRE